MREENARQNGVERDSEEKKKKKMVLGVRIFR
jgi:hypothetical protein